MPSSATAPVTEKSRRLSARRKFPACTRPAGTASASLYGVTARKVPAAKSAVNCPPGVENSCRPLRFLRSDKIAPPQFSEHLSGIGFPEQRNFSVVVPEGSIKGVDRLRFRRQGRTEAAVIAMEHRSDSAKESELLRPFRIAGNVVEMLIRRDGNRKGSFNPFYITAQENAAASRSESNWTGSFTASKRRKAVRKRGSGRYVNRQTGRVRSNPASPRRPPARERLQPGTDSGGRNRTP